MFLNFAKKVKKFKLLIITIILATILMAPVASGGTTGLSAPATSTPSIITDPKGAIKGALGEFFGSIASTAIAKMAYVINLLIGFITGLLFRLGGWLIEWTLKMNAQILNPGVNVFVYTVWEILLNLANLALILGIIYVAFLTILQMERYDKNRLLFRIIFAALIINFSLVLAGIFIDLAGVLTQYFVNSFRDTAGIASTIAGAFNPQGLLQITAKNPEDLSQAFTAFGNSTMLAIASIVFSTLFTLIAAIVLLAIAFMLLRRYVELSWRVAILPIVVISWALKIQISDYTSWKKWYSGFIKWVFFAPVMLFFIYLTLRALQLNSYVMTTGNLAGDTTGSVENSIQLKAEMSDAAALGAAASTSIAQMATVNSQAAQGVQDSLWFGINNIIGMIMATFFLIYSLKYANSISSGSVKMFEGWVNSTNAWARRKGVQFATAIPRTKTAQNLAKRGSEAGLNSGFWGRKFKAPLRGAGRLINVAGVKQGQNLVKQEADKLKGISIDDQIKRFRTFNAAQQTAILDEAVKQGKVDKFDSDLLNDVIGGNSFLSLRQAAERYGNKGVFENLEKRAGKNFDMVDALNKAGNKEKGIEFRKAETKIKDLEKKRMDEMNKEEKIKHIKEIDDTRATLRRLAQETGYDKAAQKFYAPFVGEDWNNISPSLVDLFMMDRIVEKQPSAFNGILGRAKTDKVDSLVTMYESSFREVLKNKVLETGEKADKVEESKIEAEKGIEEQLEYIKKLAADTGEDEIAKTYKQMRRAQRVRDNSINKRMYDLPADENRKINEEIEKMKQGKSGSGNSETPFHIGSFNP